MRLEDQKCPKCGGSLMRDTRENKIEFNGRTITYNQPAWWCVDRCGETVLDPGDIKIWDAEVKRLKNV